MDGVKVAGRASERVLGRAHYEDDARLLLEGLVRGANASEPEPEEAQADPADERMTAAFRGFGGGDGGA